MSNQTAEEKWGPIFLEEAAKALNVDPSRVTVEFREEADGRVYTSIKLDGLPIPRELDELVRARIVPKVGPLS